MEIEVKFQLDRPNYDRMIAWIEGFEVPMYVQLREYYFDKDGTPFAKGMSDKGYVDALSTLRLRFDDQKAMRCEKLRILDPASGKTTHREEAEVECTPAAGEKERARLLAEGYTETCLSKKRCTCIYARLGSLFEIVYDVVEGLGQFFEIELKDPSVTDAAVGLQKVYDLLRAIGITKLTVFDRGYIHMAWNPGFNFGEEVVLERASTV